MTIHAAFHRRTAAALVRLVDRGVLRPDRDVARFSVVSPPAAMACDLVLDAALVHAGAGDGSPMELARLLAGELEREPGVVAAVAAGPGFVNVTLSATARGEALAALLREHEGPVAGGTAFAAVVGRCQSDDMPLDEGRAAAISDALAALDAVAARDDPATARRTAGGARPDEAFACGPVSIPTGQGGPRPGLRAALDAVGVDALRFAFASPRPAAPLVLDLDRLAERTRDNPLFWIRYVHARAKASRRGTAAAGAGVDLSRLALASAPFALLDAPGEIALARAVLRQSQVVSACAAVRSAHRLAADLYALATTVHDQWNRSKDQPQLRFVNEEQRDLTKARLGLVTASTLVLESGLGIFGVAAPDEMP